MNDPKKNPRAIPKLPRGFADFGPADIAATEKMLAAIKETYALYGFEAVETPFIEYTEALGKFLPDQDRPNEGVFSFQDDDEQWLSLRYDLTAPLARYVAENFDRLPKPYRSYRVGNVFRNEKPGPGRYRQFMQFDADTVGTSSIAADAELCMMAADTLERLGIKRGDYVIKVNNRKVLDGLMEVVGLGGPENVGRRLTVLRAIDKYDRLGGQGVRELLGPGRKDESGDFTKGAMLSDEKAIDALVLLVDSKTSEERILAAVAAEQPGAINFVSLDWAEISRKQISSTDAAHIAAFGMSNSLALGVIQAFFWNVGSDVTYRVSSFEGYQELLKIAALTHAAGYSDRIRIDPSVVRGLEYYTGPVFEADLTFEVQGEDGKPVRFGSVGGGGRYDGLVGRFRDADVPATGFSIGVSRLYAALKAINSPIVGTRVQRGPVVVLLLDKEVNNVARYQNFVAQLRNEGIPSELYLGSSGMNAQLKYADKRGAVCAVIQGSNERAEGQIAIRDLVLGAELAASTKDRADYLDLRGRAHFTVPEAELVRAVKEVLARHE
jgi:histidyl-tRNA synthetase